MKTSVEKLGRTCVDDGRACVDYIIPKEGLLPHVVEAVGGLQKHLGNLR